MALAKSFFKLGGCLCLLIKLYLLNTYFVCSSASCSNWKTNLTMGTKLILFGFKVVTKAKKLASVLALGDYGSSNCPMQFIMWRICGYLCETKTFSISLSPFCLALLFSTIVWILLPRLKRTFVLQCFGWYYLN